jgi:hypothetical protein
MKFLTNYLQEISVIKLSEKGGGDNTLGAYVLFYFGAK